MRRTAALVALVLGCLGCVGGVGSPTTSAPRSPPVEPSGGEPSSPSAEDGADEYAPPPVVVGDDGGRLVEIGVDATRLQLFPRGRTMIESPTELVMLDDRDDIEFAMGDFARGDVDCPFPCSVGPGDATRWVSASDGGVHVLVDLADDQAYAIDPFDETPATVWSDIAVMLPVAGADGTRVLGLSPNGVVRVLAAATGEEVGRHDVAGYPADLDPWSVVEDHGHPTLLIDSDGDRWVTVDLGEDGSAVVADGTFGAAAPVDPYGTDLRVGMLLTTANGTVDLRTGELVPGSAESDPVVGVAGSTSLLMAPDERAAVAPATDAAALGVFTVRTDGVDSTMRIADGLVRGITALPGEGDWFLAATGRAVSLVQLTDEGLRVAWVERFTDQGLGDLVELEVDDGRVVLLYSDGERSTVVTVPLTATSSGASF